MGKHQKHTKLKKPASGFYARNEWGLVGTNCGLIKQISQQISSALGDKYKVSYMDADHSKANDGGPKYHLEYEDKISHHRFETDLELNSFDYKEKFKDSDLHLINGNHFLSQKQIIFIDKEKEKSLLKRIDQLTDIRAVVMKDQIEIFDSIKEKIDSRNIPIISIENVDQLIAVIETDLSSWRMKVKALVLAGGKSMRMGKDKSLIEYYGKPQAIHLFDLIEKHVEEVYISTTKEDEANWNRPVITDSFIGLGPFGAILSAFREDPDSAWLVVACDLPFIEDATIRTLIDKRDASRIATAFYNQDTDFPDPLITLWEPKAYQRILNFLSQGYSCPRKVLINSDIKLLEPHGNWLRNVNNPEDLEEVLKELDAMKP